MFARLAGLAVLIPAAAVGLTAQLVAAPAGYLIELQRRRTPDLVLPVVRTAHAADEVAA
jgi:hypothetical protein